MIDFRKSLDKPIPAKLSRRQRRYFNRCKERLASRIKNNEQHNYNNMLDRNVIFDTIKLCLRGVRWKSSVGVWDLTPLQHTLNIEKTLLNKDFYCCKRTSHTIYERGKRRDINAVNTYERVIQKLLCQQVVNPILFKTLIHQNCASQKNKGTDFALNLTKKYIKEEIKQNKEIYYLKMDFTKYFASIPHDILFSEVCHYIFDKDVLGLLEKMIVANGKTGLDLGSEINQTFAIYYTNKIDHLIKDKFRFKHYVRYMDDAIIFSSDINKIKLCLEEIKKISCFLKLKLSKNKTKIGKLSKSVIFLKTKYQIINNKLKISALNNIYHRQRRKIKRMLNLLNKPNHKITIEDIFKSNQCWEASMIKKNGWKYINKIRAFIDDTIRDFIIKFSEQLCVKTWLTLLYEVKLCQKNNTKNQN